MLIQIKCGKLSDHELIYLHDCLADAIASCCDNYCEIKDGERICPCKAHRVCSALTSAVRYLEKQLPQFYSPGK